MLDENEVELESSSATPLEQVYAKEFAQGVLKAGSAISMIENKKLNPINLFLCLIENKNYQEFFTEITSSSSFRDALRSLMLLYPSLAKSKITKLAVKQLANEYRNRAAKAAI